MDTMGKPESPPGGTDTMLVVLWVLLVAVVGALFIAFWVLYVAGALP
jgi:hypothetical protein